MSLIIDNPIISVILIALVLICCFIAASCKTADKGDKFDQELRG